MGRRFLPPTRGAWIVVALALLVIPTVASAPSTSNRAAPPAARMATTDSAPNPVAGPPTPLNWSFTNSSTHPPPFSSFAMIADFPPRHEVVLFGAGAGNETWVFRNRTWTNLTATLSQSPGPRASGGFVYDARDGYAVLFGGTGTCSVYYACNDTWSFNGTRWTQLHPATSPPRMWRFGMTYDAADRDVVVFGGNVYPGSLSHATWTYAGGSWTNATRASAPSSRVDVPLTYDPTTRSVVLYGGFVPGVRFGPNSSTWSFHGGVWTRLHPSPTPPGLAGSPIVFDAALAELVLYGGYQSHGSSYSTWAYSGGGWTNLTPTLSPFTSTPDPAGLGVYAPGLQEFLIFGPTGYWALS